MINYFSKYKFIFYLCNLIIIFLYLFPGSVLGWFLYKDLDDHVVYTWSRKEKAEEVLNLLTCHRAEITEDIPAPALARSTEKKQKLKLET